MRKVTIREDMREGDVRERGGKREEDGTEHKLNNKKREKNI